MPLFSAADRLAPSHGDDLGNLANQEPKVFRFPCLGDAVPVTVAEGRNIAASRRIGGQEDDVGPGRKRLEGFIETQDGQRTTQAPGVNDNGLQCVGLRHAARTVVCCRLEKKGMLSSYLTDPTPERGGRARRCYRATKPAIAALRASRRALLSLWEGVRTPGI